MLINNLGLLTIEISEIINFWPVLLIIWGIAILKIPTVLKYILSSLSGVLLALIIVSTMFSAQKAVTNFEFFDDENVNVSFNTEESIGIDSNIRIVNLDISAGASSLIITDSDDKETLVQTNSKTLVMNENSVNDSLKNVDITVGPAENEGNNGTRSEIKLSRIPVYNIDLSGGASKLTMDLSKIKVRKMSIDAGAASITLKLGNLMDTTKIVINSGAAKFSIKFPNDSYCFINAETALSTSNFTDFKKIHANEYVFTPKSNNGKVVLIEFEGALSTINVEPYK